MIKKINAESALITWSFYCEHFRQGVGLYTLYYTLYIIITSIITKLVSHRCLMWEEINYRITRRRAESGMGAQPLFLIFFFSFSWHFLSLSFSISCFLFPFLDAMAYFCPCPWDSLSYFINCSQFLPVFHCFVSFC